MASSIMAFVGEGNNVKCNMLTIFFILVLLMKYFQNRTVFPEEQCSSSRTKETADSMEGVGSLCVHKVSLTFYLHFHAFQSIVDLLSIYPYGSGCTVSMCKLYTLNLRSITDAVFYLHYFQSLLVSPTKSVTFTKINLR